ncbi:MAG: MXAN_6521/LA_1396 family lipoprotein [Deltaproteobacteria bacterium]|nr:MXAN_6521/LA_1396 family lipoprotein [Deltaproteobacteria bacterium]
MSIVARARAAGLVIAAVAALAACGSPLREVYSMRPRPGGGSEPPKSVAIRVWAPADLPRAADMLAKELQDVVRLRRNYLVYSSAPIGASYADACTVPAVDAAPPKALGGVLLLRVLHAEPEADEIAMTLALELYHCADGALLWRAEAGDTVTPADPDLRELSRAYSQEFGELADRYAAPAFVLIKALVEALPNPVLTDDEIALKIELESS